jgi:hypothetical protein
MSPLRGIFMVALGAFALWRGWIVHAYHNAWPLYGLGAAAIALGAWHLSGRSPRPRT